MRPQTSLAIRNALPEPVKRALRGLRLLVTRAPPSAPTIPQHLLDGCKLLQCRHALLAQLPKGGVVAEIGTQAGHFAQAILTVCRPETLHLVDLTFEDLRADVRAHPAVRLHLGPSADLLARFPDDLFDWVYVDADHGYEGVRQDAQAAKAKVKPGGLLVFNDFARIVRPGLGTFGVHQAVSEFAVAEGWPLAFFCLQGEALYDVALRRPAHPAGGSRSSATALT